MHESCDIYSLLHLMCHLLRSVSFVDHTATHCNVPQHTAILFESQVSFDMHAYLLICASIAPHVHTATHSAHCNTLQHTATHCNTLQHTATHCNTLQHVCINRATGTCHLQVSLSLTHTHTLAHTHMSLLLSSRTH